VTSLAEVNGRRAYARRYAETKRILRGTKTGAGLRRRSRSRARVEAKAMRKTFTAAQRRAMHKMSPARRAAFSRMLQKAPSVASLRRRRPNRGKPTAKPKASRGTRRVRIPGALGGGSLPPVVVTPGFARPSSGLKRPAKREFMQEQIEKGRSYAQAEAAYKRAHGKGKPKRRKARKPRAYGARRQIHPIRVRIGTRTRQTTLYRTRRGKTRRVPGYAYLGYPSAYAMRLEMSTRRGAERGLRKKERLQARRERAAVAEAKRIRAGRGLFVPNRAGGATIDWQEWRDMYKPNKRRGRKARKGRKLTKAQRARISRRNLVQARKALRRRHGGVKRGKAKRRTRRYEDNRRRTTRRTTRRRYTSNLRGKARRTRKMTRAEKRAMALRHLAKARRARRLGPARRKMGKWARIKGRKGARRVTFRTAGTRFGAVTLYRNRNGSVSLLENGRRGRRRSRRRYDANRRQVSRYEDNRRRRRVRRYDENRRRHRSRRYRSNAAAWVSGLKEALKIGGIVIVGFLVHRSLTRVLSDEALSKIGALADGTSLGAWRDVIAGLLVAALGVPLVVKFVPSESAAIGGGIAASFLHGIILRALTEAGQPKVAGYLASYPDQSGPAYPGVGSYYRVKPRQQYRGVGEFYSTQPNLRYDQMRQPAAGVGSGALVTQAAAGAGEYLAFGARAMGGDYSEVPMLPMPTVTNEGVMPTMDAAEAAINVMEAAAGVGASEIPMQSDLYPEDQSDPIGDEPGGSRSGVFSGNGGIFGG
jgi:hypothetical protein